MSQMQQHIEELQKYPPPGKARIVQGMMDILDSPTGIVTIKDYFFDKRDQCYANISYKSSDGWMADTVVFAHFLRSL